ncbi:MAG: helix-turn-helix domain-containing protein [Dehalococcoidia bacterium]
MNRKAEVVREAQATRVAALKAALQATGGQAKVWELFQLLTSEEAADFLALDLGTVRNLTYRKGLPCVKVGRRGVRYQVLELLAWIEDRHRPALR